MTHQAWVDAHIPAVRSAVIDGGLAAHKRAGEGPDETSPPIGVASLVLAGTRRGSNSNRLGWPD